MKNRMIKVLISLLNEEVQPKRKQTRRPANTIPVYVMGEYAGYVTM